MNSKLRLPDITKDSFPDNPRPLNWVGMEGIHVPMTMRDTLLGAQPVSARADLFVNLQDPQARGIHMSRMYLSLNRLSSPTETGYAELENLTKELLALQQGLSNASQLKIAFTLSVQRESLVSGHRGWIAYPVVVRMINRNDRVSCQLDIEIAYSSTCPCSASLARQQTAKQFTAYFNEHPITPTVAGKWIREEEKGTAVPHSQRSLAQLSFIIEPSGKAFPFVQIIDKAEEALKLPVQGVVKRADEQDFARLTGENLMFCEDAARSLVDAFPDYARRGLGIKVRHLESLHPHDAVAQLNCGSLLE